MNSVVPILGIALPLTLAAGRVDLRDEYLGMTALDFPMERTEQHATPSLIAEMDALAPGETCWIAVRFQIDSGWHLYWNGKNDSGTAPAFSATLPAGFTLGDWLWPAPTRHISPGEILDHVYKGSVVLMAPITVPKDAQIGSSVSISIAADWVICDENICVPESATARQEFLVRTKPTKSKDAGAFESARQRHARAWPKDSKDFGATFSMNQGVRQAAIHVAGASHLEFYPSLKSAEVKNLIKAGVADSDTLTLPLADGKRGLGPLQGVLAVTKSANTPIEFYNVNIDPLAAPPSSPPANSTSGK